MRPSHRAFCTDVVTAFQPVTRRRTASSPATTDTRAVPASPGSKASTASSSWPSPFGLKGSGAMSALLMSGATVSSRRVAVAERASPSALVASTCSEYTPSGCSLPSSSLPAHVVSTTLPSPLWLRTSLPASSRISRRQVAV